MQIPINLIEVKYTVGNEFVYSSNYEPYQGYYYELNNKFFIGKTFNPNSPEIISINKVNPLLVNPKTSTYGSLSKINFNNKKPASFTYRYEEQTRYFVSSINRNIIKEVNKKTFDEFKNNPLYISIALDYMGGFDDLEVNKAENKMPGIRTFIDTSYVPPPFEENGDVG